MRRVIVIVAGVLAAAACSTSVAPRAIRSGEVCFRCRRVIIDERLSAQTIDGGLISTFKSPKCVAKYLADHRSDRSRVFVTDYASDKPVPADKAFYVPTRNRDNGEEDFVAYKDRAAADAEARTRSTAVVQWTTVLERARS